MTDRYLRFPDQPAALAAFAPLGMTYTDDEGTERASQGSHQFALWVLGEIPGIEGWHVNLRVVDPEFDVSSLEVFCIHPQQPVCIWA